MKWIKRAAIVVATAAFLYFAAIYGYYFYLNSLPKESRYLIPDGYVGWIVIHYIDKSSPDIPNYNGVKIYKIPPSGEFRTSYNPTTDQLKEKRYGSEYFYYSESGLKPIPQELVDWRGNQGKVEDDGKYSTFETRLWVGTQEQYARYGMSQYERPQPGSIMPLLSNEDNKSRREGR